MSGMKADAIAGVIGEAGYACGRSAAKALSRTSPGGGRPFPELGVIIGTCRTGALGLPGRALGRERPCTELFDGARR
jgi:hypothetical protein